MANDAKSLWLTVPGYRRWLTPDMLDSVLQIRGFSAEDLEHAQIRLTMTDTEEDNTDMRLIRVLPGEKELVFRSPRFHSGGELMVFLEKERTEKLEAEAKWDITRMPQDALDEMAYFDSRGVLIVSNAARFPRIWETDRPLDDLTARLKMLAKAGVNVLLPTTTLSTTEIAKLTAAAAAEKIAIIVPAMGDSDQIDAVRSRVRECRDIDNIFGYALPAPGQGRSESTIEQLYLAVRRSDPRRFSLVRMPGHPPVRFESDYEDTFAIEGPPPGEVGRNAVSETILRGNPAIGSIPPMEEDEAKSGGSGVRYRAYESLAQGAFGCLYRENSQVEPPAPVLLLFRELQALNTIFVRGQRAIWPVKPADQEEAAASKLTFWQRRLDDDFVLAVLSSNDEEKILGFTVPPGTQTLYVLGTDRQIPVTDGKAKDLFAPWEVHAYTTSAAIAKAAMS